MKMNQKVKKNEKSGKQINKEKLENLINRNNIRQIGNWYKKDGG